MAQFLLETVNDKKRAVKRVFVVEGNTLGETVSYFMSIVKYRNPPITQAPYTGVPAVIDPIPIGPRIVEI